MSDRVSRAELVAVLDRLSAKLPARKLSREAAGYLLDQKRTGELDSLARELVNYRAKNGVVEVTALSAQSLSSATISDIKQKVKKLYPGVHRIIINQQLDHNLVGGVRLELPDKQLDLSVRAKLNKFKQLTVGN